MNTKQTRMRRLVAVLITIVIAVGIMPTFAFAEQHVIFLSTPEDMTMPVLGGNLEPQITLDKSKFDPEKLSSSLIHLQKYDAEEEIWKSLGSMSPSDLSDSGVATLTIVNRGVPGTTKYRWAVQTPDEVWQHSDEFTVTFTGTPIDKIVIDMTVLVGERPSDVVTSINSDQYTVRINRWYYYNTENAEVNQKNDEPFIEGINYHVVFVVIAKVGNYFGEDPEITITGENADRISINAMTGVCTYDAHAHVFGTEWESDSSKHWRQACNCGDNSKGLSHTYGEWTVTKAATTTETGSRERVCTECAYVQTEVLEKLHSHSYTGAWQSNSSGHWRKCSCGEKSAEAAHTFGEWETVKEATETEQGAKMRECTVCGYMENDVIPILTHTHNYTGEWEHDSANHWKVCECGEKSVEEAHTFGEWVIEKQATETEQGEKKHTCTACGHTENEVIPVVETVPPDADSFPWTITIIAGTAVAAAVVLTIIFVKKKKK